MGSGAHKTNKGSKMNKFKKIIVQNTRIGGSRYKETMTKIKRAATIARRNGLPEPKVIEEREFYTTERKDRNFLGYLEYQQAHVELTIDRPLVQLEGYTAIAHIDEIGVISRLCAEDEFSEADMKKLRKDREKSFMHCDHCNTSRKRKMVIVYREDATGRLKSFGRSCLQLILGISISNNYFNPKAFDLLNGEPDAFGSLGWKESVNLSIENILSLAFVAIKVHGYLSKSKALNGGMPTSEVVANVLCDEKERERLIMQLPQNKKGQHVSIGDVKAVREFILKSTSTSEYMTNMRIIFKSDYITFRHIGYVVSAIPAKMRHDSQMLERKSQPVSTHVGTVGERVFKNDPTAATLIFAKYMSGNYGPTTLMKFRTENGNIMTWFASGSYDVEAGDALTITGATVKAHAEYNGVKETRVNRVAVDWS